MVRLGNGTIILHGGSYPFPAMKVEILYAALNFRSDDPICGPTEDRDRQLLVPEAIEFVFE